MSLNLSSLHIYPVKSCRGLSLNSVQVGAKGPGLDRRWMIIDEKGRFISQRQHSEMALIETALETTHLIFTIPSYPSFFIPLDLKGTNRTVEIWKDTCQAIDAGNEVAYALSDFLKKECRLVFMPEKEMRAVNPKYAKRAEDEVGFADGYPFLLISEASLADLNSRLETSVSMDRFRPNLVISNSIPFEEDTWELIQIGNIRFHVVKPCSRCIVVNIDQDSSQSNPEILQILSAYRKGEKGVFFGQNLIHEDKGVLKVGDAVQVLRKRPS